MKSDINKKNAAHALDRFPRENRARNFEVALCKLIFVTIDSSLVYVIECDNLKVPNGSLPRIFPNQLSLTDS